MNLEGAASESFSRFLDFHAEFNKGFKLAVAALVHVARVVSGKGGASIVQGIIADTGEPWRIEEKLSDPSEHFKTALLNMSLLGLVQIHSAIDDYIVSLDADIHRWEDFEGKRGRSARQQKMENEDDEVERLESMCRRHGWDTTPFDAWRPLLTFFRAARNCVAHRSGIATTRLKSIGDEADTKSAIASWAEKRPGAKPPPLPVVSENSKLVLSPRHVIFALEVVYRVCSYLNDCCKATLAERGFVQMAAHHALLVGDPRVYTEAYRSPEAVVVHVLTSRYRVALIGGKATIKLLIELGIWAECRKRHGELYGSPPQPFKAHVKSS